MGSQKATARKNKPKRQQQQAGPQPTNQAMNMMEIDPEDVIVFGGWRMPRRSIFCHYAHARDGFVGVEQFHVKIFTMHPTIHEIIETGAVALEFMTAVNDPLALIYNQFKNIMKPAGEPVVNPPAADSKET